MSDPVEPIVCPACGMDHEPGKGRFDRRSQDWAECWDMTEAGWALLKDASTSPRVKRWARGLLGLDDRTAENAA